MIASRAAPPKLHLDPPMAALAGRKHNRDESSQSDAPSPTRPSAKHKRVRFAETSLGHSGSLASFRTPEPARPAATADKQMPFKTSVVIAGSMFKKFVGNALDERAAGKTVHYEELRRKFQLHPEDEEAPSSEELQMTLVALTNVVSRLGHACSALIRDIVETRWVGRDGLLVSAYVRFLGNLVSAHANYMGVVTKMLVGILGYLPSSVGRMKGHPVVERSVMYDRVHYALQFILDLVPTAAQSTLFPALVAGFPHRSEKKLEHTCYLANILRVIEYVPSLRHKLLSVVTDRVIKIDIEIQVDLDELDEEEQVNDLEAELSNLDDEPRRTLNPFDEEDSEDDEEVDDHDAPEARDTVATIKKTVDKLDSTLDLLLNYYSSSFPGKCAIDPSQAAINTFDMLHSFFNNTILPTHRSRYTQFLIFWAAQKAPRFSDQFCVSMLEKAMDNTRPVRTRQAASAYLASYVARAKLMPVKDVRAVVRILCRWLSEFVDLRSAECIRPDVNRWAGFYAITQAVMYIFCFRYRELREENDEDGDGEFPYNPQARWTEGLEVMNKVVTSRFNPLKVCSAPVVEMFAKIAHHLQFVFCYSIIDQNKRRGGTGGEETTVEAYFPFDPLLLKKCRRWIDDVYVVWRPVEGLDDEEAMEDSSDEDGEDEEEDEAEQGDDAEDSDNSM